MLSPWLLLPETAPAARGCPKVLRPKGGQIWCPDLGRMRRQQHRHSDDHAFYCEAPGRSISAMGRMCVYRH